MMTNHQHDEAWLNVMERQVPAAVEEINLLRKTIRNSLTLNTLTILHQYGSIDEKCYLQTIMQLTNGVWDKPLFDEEEINNVKTKD